jgi:hypothetical protein
MGLLRPHWLGLSGCCALCCAGVARGAIRLLARIGDAGGEHVGRSEERLQLAVAGSKDGLFDYDPVRRHLFLSDDPRRLAAQYRGSSVLAEADGG